MESYIFTVRGSHSDEDAQDFMVSILSQEYCPEAGDEARRKTFRRVLAQTDEEIAKRIAKMHENSPIEYSFKGMDKDSKLPIHTFWGITIHKDGVTQ